MAFVGIVCETKYENQIRLKLEKELEKNIIILTQENIENFKNVTFEMIAVFSNHNVMEKKKEVLKSIIEKTKYLIMNADEFINLELMNNLDLQVITYGFNSKSTVTASSVKEEEIFICIQREIKNIQNKKIELQDILVKNVSKNTNTNIIIGIATILLIYGIREIFI